jgi:hypothetical protein
MRPLSPPVPMQQMAVVVDEQREDVGFVIERHQRSSLLVLDAQHDALRPVPA